MIDKNCTLQFNNGCTWNVASQHQNTTKQHRFQCFWCVCDSVWPWKYISIKQTTHPRDPTTNPGDPTCIQEINTCVTDQQHIQEFQHQNQSTQQ